MLNETKRIDDVETRVVEEKETKGESSSRYPGTIAISKRTKSVYYFGEDVDMYKNGRVVSHDGRVAIGG